MDKEIENRINLLQEKFAVMGQDLTSYLDGLLYADYLTYWDYIHLDTLLSLQSPRTSFKDETIFIVYHQITELYFKLCLHEMQQISEEPLQAETFKTRIVRINRYFEALTKSFEIMVNGMDKEQFLKFRMSLLPASGFQSGQYRKIELWSTSLINLVAKDKRPHFVAQGDKALLSEMIEHLYWKNGATELATGKKTLTLIQFESKYMHEFLDIAKKAETNNIWAKYNQLSAEEQQNQELINSLKQLDVDVNINWPLQHYKSAARYLQKAPEDIAATGGTNWQKYLPPKFQKRIFYPALWSEEELENWGRTFVKSLFDANN